ncbi:MAG: hypothetical protein JKY43_06160 [Phycisphaerales bacterium]|nr:hypothetical protein [Phycisphaerales bacterium]
MNKAFTTVILTATLTTLAAADIYIEIDFAGSGPDGQTTGDLVIFDPTPLSVWIWADEPGLTIMDLSLQINGQSRLGIPNSGGILTFDSVGTADPNSNFAITADGTLDAGNTLINNLFFSNLILPTNPLPTSMQTAWLLYTDFTGTATEPFAGVMPIIDSLILQSGDTSQTIHTYGLYQTPTPNTLALLTLAGLLTTKRRR